MPGPAPHPIHQIKRHDEGRERWFITQPAIGSGKRQSIAHLQPSLGYRYEV
jgi:hypothetical protein